MKEKIVFFSRTIFNSILLVAALMYGTTILAQQKAGTLVAGNPVIKNKYTADPAAFVHGDSVYLYTGHDEGLPGKDGYVMHEWLCFSSADMVHWNEHPVPLNVKDFTWSKNDAWASQVIERNGKFYWYVATEHATIPGKAIGVAVADNPAGPFKDAIGKALVTNNMTSAESKMMWDDIDPSVIIDDDGQAYLFWGNRKCYYAKLKPNMVELDSEIKAIDLLNFTEAPWIHKRNGWYYLSYAYEFPEKIAYAMSRNINGPWIFKDIINEVAGNSNTNHQAIIDFKGLSYFIYHNGSLPTDGGSFRRSVCIDYLHYNEDGTIKRVIMTTEGVKATK
ncbi:MAG: glycoside hydrolase family 43 protein [Ferruginibacter sp.]